MRRAPLFAIFLLFLGFGAAATLSYAWLLAPAQPTDTPPSRLNAADREEYLRLVADSLAADGDRSAAARRVAGLGDEATADLLALIAAEVQAQPAGSTPVRLAALAAALELDDPLVALLAPPRPLAAATALPQAGPTAAPAAATTPEAAANEEFALVELEQICMPGEAARRIEVVVEDADGEALPGIAVTVTWDGGRDRFVTGFNAGQDAGYGDFAMEAGVDYAVAVGEDQPAAADLQLSSCPNGQEGGWRLAFRATDP